MFTFHFAAPFMGKATVVLHGSSHFTPRHHFKRFFEKLWQHQHLDDFYFPHLNYSIGGKKLDEQVVKSIKDFVDQHQEPQVHIVALCDNNLREAAGRNSRHPEQQQKGTFCNKHSTF